MMCKLLEQQVLYVTIYRTYFQIIYASEND